MPLGGKMLSSSHLRTPKVDLTKWGLVRSSRPNVVVLGLADPKGRLDKMGTHQSRCQLSEFNIPNRDLLDLTLQDLQPWDREEDRRYAERLHTLPRHAAFSHGTGRRIVATRNVSTPCLAMLPSSRGTGRRIIAMRNVSTPCLATLTFLLAAGQRK